VHLFEDKASAFVQRHRYLACVDGLDAAGQLLQFGNVGLAVRSQALRQMRGFSALREVLL